MLHSVGMRQGAPEDSDTLFARLVVEQGLAKREQVEECLKLRAELTALNVSPLPRLGELLVRNGYLSLDQFHATMRVSERPAPQVPSPAVEPDLPPDVAPAARNPSNLYGNYVRVAHLGAGGMGEVWKAWDRKLNRWVALKFLKQDDPEAIARFSREAQTAAHLSHPNIASIYETGKENGKFFIAMQYVEGETLLTFPRNDIPLLAELVRDAALTVHFAHLQKVIHRDLKPENLMVERRPESDTTRRATGDPKRRVPRVFVMDFGMSKETSVNSSLSLSGVVLGTPSYMPPEQARGSREVDARCDVYSLGATLYQLLTGRPPFFDAQLYEILRKVVEEEPRLARHWNSRIKRELEAIVMKCLEKDPARRYATALELAEDLTRWLDGEAILAHAPSPFYRLRKYVARKKALVTTLAAPCWRLEESPCSSISPGMRGWNRSVSLKSPSRNNRRKSARRR